MSNLPVRIHLVDETDTDIVADITQMHSTCFPGYDIPGFAGGHWWIAYQKASPVAFCALWRSSKRAKAGYLARAGVLPKARGQGLQRRMIKTRERAARELGWHTMLCDTVQDNVRSANNLIKCGYELYVPREKWAPDPAALYWIKTL